MALGVGDRIPSFELTDQNGDRHSSASLGGQSLVLFFYPKDDTPGCTMEACAFRDSYHELQQLGAEVWGISGDDAGSHRRFAERHRLPYPLLVDAGNRVREAFGVAKAMFVLPGRVTYVIDGAGVVRLVYNSMLDATAHVSQAKTALRQLKG